MKRLAALMGVLVLVAIAAWAQDTSSESGNDNGFLLNLLENQLSAPGRQIRLSGVSGALSSQAKIGKITISDDTGAWLEIDNVELDWNRLALLRGRVSVNRLSAERIDWLRKANPPPPARELPKAEAQPFALPELPVSIQVEELALNSVTFDQSVFGQAAELSATGKLSLAGGALDTTLGVKRLDEPGGALDLNAAFSNETRQLDIDLDLHEPKGGLVATLLKIEGTPAIDLSATGSGPLDEVDVTFALDADMNRIVDGVVALRSKDDGLGFAVDLGGELAPLIPAEYRDFFAGHSMIEVQGVNKSAGGIRIDNVNVAGAVLNLKGDLETGSDYFLRRLNLTGSMGDPAAKPVVLPVPGGQTRLQSAVFDVSFGNSSQWDGLVVLDRLEAGGIAIEDLTLGLGGLSKELDDPAKRLVTITAEGLATGVSSDDPDVARALGTRIDLFADVALNPGGPVDVRQFQVSGNGLSIFSAGELSDLVYTGRNAVRVADLGAFAGVAGRDLSGAIDLHANGSVTPLSQAFDLTLDGTATDLKLSDPRLDALLAGETILSGRAVRDSDGFRTENLRLDNPQLAFASDGRISSDRTDFGFDAALSDLGLVDSRLAGKLVATGRATGSGSPIDVTLSADIAKGRLMDRALTNARIGFDGQVDGGDVTGALSGGGSLDGLVMQLAGDLGLAGENRSISGLEVRVGPNRLTGDVAKNGGAPIVGKLTLNAPDIAPLAALALTEATGAIDADITLDAAETGQGVGVNAKASNLALGANRIDSLDARAQIADALGLPIVDGELNAEGLSLAGVDVASVHATADRTDPETMTFDVESRLAIGTMVDLGGELKHLDDGFAARLDTLDLRQTSVSATLVEPATISLRNGAVDLTPLNLSFDTGSLSAKGRIDENFDIDVALHDLPLGIANAIKPALEIAGTVNGSARVTGPRNAPDITFDLAAAGLASSMTRNAGLPPVALDAKGQTDGGRLNLDATVAATGLAAKASGSVPLGAGDLDLAIDLQSFPLALVDQIAGNRGLRGTVSGTGTATGPLTDPTVKFDLRGEGLTADMLTANAIPPLALTAAGSYQGAALQLDAAHVTGAGGLDLDGSGRIPFTGSGLDANLSGTVPLTVANPLIAERAAQTSGQLQLRASARGSLASPQLSGNVTLQGGTLVDPQTNIRLENIALDAGLEGNTARLRSFRAEVATGGAITAQGTVSLASGLAADLTARIEDVRYTDGVFVSTRVSGDLAMKGPLVGAGGLLSGQIELGRTEISVAEGLGANAQAALDQVSHVGTPPSVQATIDRARVSTSKASEPGSGGPGIGLDIRISAPNQIFVRGRGLDVELGGNLRVRGTTTDIQPVGQFDMRRGRLLVLGQRIEFDEGSLQLIGNLDPLVHFVARTQSGNVTAIVTVDGRVSAPEITFSSEPQLPQDEVLARVLFNTATQDLSPFQLAQLAAAAAELAGGGGGPGILSQIRGATGLDNLDIITEEGGATAVRAGKYISENVYLDVQTDSEGLAQAQVNYDINDSITARGSVGSDGNTTIGLFFERDY